VYAAFLGICAWPLKSTARNSPTVMSAQGASWIEASEVLALFPTYVWKLQLVPEVHAPLNARILDTITGMRRSLPALDPGQAWQSAQELHELPGLGVLLTCVEEAVRTVLRFLRVGYDAFEVTACWANVNAPGASHAVHMHPNNYLSGVYYVRTQPGADTVNFHDPRVQTAIIRPPVTELTSGNTDQVVVPVCDGTLLLFPAYLIHSVSPNASDRERVSVSFNVMFTAFTEHLSKPLW
jgi:uncharacterized protein (TIGR02466 family)